MPETSRSRAIQAFDQLLLKMTQLAVAHSRDTPVYGDAPLGSGDDDRDLQLYHILSIKAKTALPPPPKPFDEKSGQCYNAPSCPKGNMTITSNQQVATTRKTHLRVGLWVWQWCLAKETLLALFIFIALAFALSRAIPQAPTQARSDPAGYHQWLSTIPAWFKDRAPWLNGVGLFHIDDTLWFHFLLAASAFVALVSLGNRAHSLFRPPTVKQSDPFYDAPGALSIVSTGLPTQVANEVEKTFNTLVGSSLREKEGQVYLYGSRARWTKALTSLLHLGLLFVVCGLAVNGRWGWHQVDVQVLPGESVLVGPAAVHEIQLPATQTGLETTTLQVGAQRQVDLRRFSTAHLGTFRYQRTGKGGPLVQLRAQDSAGNTLTLHEYTVRPEPVTSLRFAFSSSSPQQEADRLFIVSQAKVVGRLQYVPPHFHLWVFRQDGQTLVGDAVIPVEGTKETVSIADITFTIEISRHIVLNLSYHPGFWLLVSGIVLLIAGLLATLFPPQEMWASVRAQSSSVEVRIRASAQGRTLHFQQRRDAALNHLRAKLEEIGRQ